jgi:hypothetical protein
MYRTTNITHYDHPNATATARWAATSESDAAVSKEGGLRNVGESASVDSGQPKSAASLEVKRVF